jgi:hypothetical protein
MKRTDHSAGATFQTAFITEDHRVVRGIQREIFCGAGSQAWFDFAFHTDLILNGNMGFLVHIEDGGGQFISHVHNSFSSHKIASSISFSFECKRWSTEKRNVSSP